MPGVVYGRQTDGRNYLKDIADAQAAVYAAEVQAVADAADAQAVAWAADAEAHAVSSITRRNAQFGGLTFAATALAGYISGTGFSGGLIGGIVSSAAHVYAPGMQVGERIAHTAAGAAAVAAVYLVSGNSAQLAAAAAAEAVNVSYTSEYGDVRNIARPGGDVIATQQSVDDYMTIAGRWWTATITPR